MSLKFSRPLAGLFWEWKIMAGPSAQAIGALGASAWLSGLRSGPQRPTSAPPPGFQPGSSGRTKS